MVVTYDWLPHTAPLGSDGWSHFKKSIHIPVYPVCKSLLSGMISGECCILEPFSITFLLAFGEKYRNHLKALLCFLGESNLLNTFMFSPFFFFVRYLLKTILQDCLYWMLVEQLWKQQLEPRDNIPNYFQAAPQHSQCSLVLLSEMSRCLCFHFRSSISLLCMLAPICRCVLCTDVTRCPWTPFFQPGQALSWSCW